MTDKDSGSAFPSFVPERPGLSLRDYFAAKAMQSFLAYHLERSGLNYQEIFAKSYAVADGMLDERDKKSCGP